MPETQHRPVRRNPTLTLVACALAAIAFALTACSGGEEAPSGGGAKPTPTAKPTPSPTPTAEPTTPAAAEPASAEDLAARGRTVYMANCIACHSQDPSVDGALGPAVTGSSRELLEARVMRGEYPEGYTPKRPSKVMIPLPHLEGELDALTAYLNAGG